MPSPRILIALAFLLAAGCATPSLTVTKVEDKEVSVDVVSVRTADLFVRGPGSLGNGARIISDAGAGVIAAGGGNVIAAGGGNVIAAGGGNFAPSFSVMASTDNHLPVARAVVQLVALDGTLVGKALETDANGKLTIGLPAHSSLSAVAYFRVNGQIYREASLMAEDGSANEGIMVDPINTMVEARVRELAGGAEQIPSATFAKLKRVWMICNKAGVDIEAEDLKNGTDDSVLTRAWDEAIASKVTNESEKAEIKSFMKEIKDLFGK